MPALEDRSIVFVYGALRSGTTVFRLMLEYHGDVTNPAEVDFMFDHLHPDPSHPTGYRYRLNELAADRMFWSVGLVIPEGLDGLDLLGSFLDQFESRRPGVLTLNLHRHADMVPVIFPKARIIHMLRDPRDVARSSIGMGWAGTLYHGVGHWLETEWAWEQAVGAINPDNVLTLTYEDLIRDTESELRRVCAFLRVPYRPSMLRYHEGTTYEKPDVALIEQWRRKSTPSEIALVEGRAGELMRRRGYVPTGNGRTPALPEKLALTVRDKYAIWKLGIERFGAVNYVGEKLARWAGLKSLSAKFKAAMDHRMAAYLK